MDASHSSSGKEQEQEPMNASHSSSEMEQE
jgi:hypothetical protein